MAETGKHQYLIFSVSSKLFASQITDVKRIISIRKIYDVPLKRDNFVGLVEFEKRVIPLFNLKKVIGNKNVDYSPSPQDFIIVESINKQDVGFLIDQVHNVVILDPDSFEDFESEIPGISKKIYNKEQEIMLIRIEEFALNIE